MGANSKIEWTDHTWNAWWGCVKVSPACTNCYAATLGGRFGVEWGPRARRRFFGEAHWAEPRRWNRAAEKAGVRRRVFCASMADVFELLPAGHPDEETLEEARGRLWRLIAETRSLDWLLLTKRPENVLGLTPVDWRAGTWPQNVWVGTTVEDQRRVDERIPHLLTIPAPVRFLSCEPLLGPVDLRRWLGEACCRPPWSDDTLHAHDCEPEKNGLAPGVDWVICGGESGPGARPIHPDWARSLRDQCQKAGVPFFFKQWGDWQPRDCMASAPDDPAEWGAGEIPLLPDGTDCRGYEALAAQEIGCRVLRRVGKKAAGRLLDGRTWDEVPGVAP